MKTYKKIGIIVATCLMVASFYLFCNMMWIEAFGAIGAACAIGLIFGED